MGGAQYQSVIHTENVEGCKPGVSKILGGQSVYNVLTFQKSRGARALLGGQMPPCPP